MQRWAVFLAEYDFKIKHIKGQDNGPTDSLSRIGRKDINESIEMEELEEYLKIHTYLKIIGEEIQSVDSKLVRRETSKDAILKRVRDFVMQGWPDKVNDCLKPFYSRRLKLSLEEDCVMWGYRIIIPQLGLIFGGLV